MTQNTRQSWPPLLVTASLIGQLVLPSLAFAQIRTDGSVGVVRQISTLNAAGAYSIPQTLGQLSGNNLFHSFNNFNINAGQSVNFTTTAQGIANVISRVTGGTTSTINGELTLTPAGGAPAFWLINPAGVTFGAGSSVHVPGAFHVSTANYLKFADGNFYADTNHTDQFSSADPQAFGFLGTTRATIEVRGGAVLSLQKSTVNVVAGDIKIDSGKITSDVGDIRVVAFGPQEGILSASGAVPAVQGNTDLLNGGMIYSTARSSSASGNVSINSGNISIDGDSYIGSGAYAGTGNAGKVAVEATGHLAVTSGSAIFSETYTSGLSGNVLVKSGSAALDGRDSTADIYTLSSTGSTGKAGNVEVSSAGKVSITNGGRIFSSTYGHSSSGAVRVSADSVELNGQGRFGSIFSFAASGSRGDAGNVEVSATKTLSAVNGGYIFSDTNASGSSGNVKVKADSVSLDATDSNADISTTAGTNATGKAGNIEITATGGIFVTTGGRIVSSTYGAGPAGNIQIGADRINLDGHANHGIFTGILTETAGNGDAGNVMVSAKHDLSIVKGGAIHSNTQSRGNAGSVAVTADNIAIDGFGQDTVFFYRDFRGKTIIDYFTGISSETKWGSSGNSGNVTVSSSGNLSIQRAGVVSTATEYAGNAGAVSVTAGSINIDYGCSFLCYTGVRSDSRINNAFGLFAQGIGNAGNVSVTTAGALSIDHGAEISSSTYTSAKGGSVHINAGSIIVDHGGLISSESKPPESLAPLDSLLGSGNAGSVAVSATGKLSVMNGGKITSNTKTSGNAGQVVVNAGSIVIDGGGLETGITSETARYVSFFESLGGSRREANSGDAGSVTVSTVGNLLLFDGGVISSNTKSSGNAGAVDVSAGNILIDRHGGTVFTRISSEAHNPSIFGSAGNAGNVMVSAKGELSVINGGAISSSAFKYTASQAGSVTVTAERILVDGQGSSNARPRDSNPFSIFFDIPLGTNTTGIFSETNDSGRGGSVSISANRNLSVVNGGQISSSTYSSGNAGSVLINADSVTIDAMGATGATGIFSNGAVGNAGSVDLTVSGSLLIQSGGQLASSTTGSGHAGTVTVKAGSIIVDGLGSSINASAQKGSSGQTGGVIVSASESVTIQNAGDVAIRNDATVESPSSLTPTAVTVSAGNINMTGGGQITSQSSGNVNASNIGVHVTERLWLNGAAVTASAVDGDGGSIIIDGGKATVLDRSMVSTSVTGTNGNAGNITISGQAMAIKNGFIQANTSAALASGGTISISVGNVIASNGSLLLRGPTPYVFDSFTPGFNVIQAASPSGLSGTVTLSSPAVDISSSLVSLKAGALQNGNFSRSPCASSGGSSFAKVGRGGLPPSSFGLIRTESARSKSFAPWDAATETPVAASRIGCNAG